MFGLDYQNSLQSSNDFGKSNQSPFIRKCSTTISNQTQSFRWFYYSFISIAVLMCIIVSWLWQTQHAWNLIILEQ